ncbi:hypothetical protein DV737_g1715, partial [Chaetothyriales sp. CBS 132003]
MEAFSDIHARLPRHSSLPKPDSPPTNAESTDGSSCPWILEHLLAYPGTYDLPLRVLQTLNANQKLYSHPLPSASLSGNRAGSTRAIEEQRNLVAHTAAIQLKSTLMHHIAGLASQPTSLPPGFIASFVRRCFPPELEQADLPKALIALDYLKDLEVRRRREVVAALDKLGIHREDLGHRNRLAKKYPGVMQWVVGIEEQERKVEQLYTQVYIGIRRWTLINELCLQPFNKANCIAMLNTLYPPTTISAGHFVQPTQQLTQAILIQQRNGFFRYIQAVERRGPVVLTSLIQQHRRPGEVTGWPSLREILDNYLTTATSILDECHEVSSMAVSPVSSSFSSVEFDDDCRRKLDFGISFGSASSRTSSQSQDTRPSTSSSFSTHSFKASDEKLPCLPVDGQTATPKSAGPTTLERIAHELRKIKSRSNVRDQSQSRTASAASDVMVRRHEAEASPARSPTPSRERSLGLKRSLKKIRSNGTLRDGFSYLRPGSRSGNQSSTDIPAFDAEEMRRKRQQWEAQQMSHQRVGSAATTSTFGTARS